MSALFATNGKCACLRHFLTVPRLIQVGSQDRYSRSRREYSTLDTLLVREKIRKSEALTMSATTTMFRAARPVFQRSAAQMAATRLAGRAAGRRFQSTSATAEQQQQSWAKRMWDSPVGVKTVHFW